MFTFHVFKIQCINYIDHWKRCVCIHKYLLCNIYSLTVLCKIAIYYKMHKPVVRYYNTTLRYYVNEMAHNIRKNLYIWKTHVLYSISSCVKILFRLKSGIFSVAHRHRTQIKFLVLDKEFKECIVYLSLRFKCKKNRNQNLVPEDLRFVKYINVDDKSTLKVYNHSWVCFGKFCSRNSTYYLT